MDDLMRATKQLEEKFVAWAKDRADVRMAVVVGSWARSVHPADEWADLDVGFSTTEPQRYFSSNEWLSEIADVMVMYPDPVGITRHVLFEGGVDASFAPLPHKSIALAVRFVPALRRLPLLAGLRRGIERELATSAEYVDRGVRVVLDKDMLAERFFALLPPREHHQEPPSQQQYLDAVHQFWFEAVWTAKHLRRGELWYAKGAGVDGQMKELLLRMMEWHAHATRGWQFDTWERGRFLEEWGDRRALEELRGAFAHYDEDDLWRALIATMATFRPLAIVTAELLGFAYPSRVDERVSEWVANCMAGRPARSA